LPTPEPFASDFPPMAAVSLAIILSRSEINSLHNFLNPPICYDCSLCSAFSASGWEQ
jgi:hypothetical protein